jgi:dipeptidyl aminopeptidase/acylaminoacyl peptidase
MINLYFWIALFILLCLVIILFVRILTYPLSYFADMDLPQIHAKELQIPVGDIDLHACLYLPTYALNKKNEAIERLPLIFLNPGWGLEIDNPLLKQWAISLALAGPYAVLAYDFRGVGKSAGPKLMTPVILDDIPKVIDFGAGLPGIDPLRMGFMGISFGALVALTIAYADERLKAIVSIVGLNNVKENFGRKPKNMGEWITLKILHLSGVKQEILSDEDNRKMSPAFTMKKDRPDLNQRIFLMNCVTDETITCESYAKNQQILKLPPTQTLVTQKGGHTGFHQELIISARVFQFFNAKLK